MPLLVSILSLLLFFIYSFGSEVNTLIESSFLIQKDKYDETPKRRYSSSYNPFGQEAALSLEYDKTITDTSYDLLSSLSAIYNTLDEDSLFDAFDHSVSYSIDLKNSGSYGKNADEILKSNLYTSIIACVQRSESLNLPIKESFQSISDRIIGNFIINPKAVQNWGGSSTSTWIESLSQIFMTSTINSSSNYNELEIAESGCGAFTKSILELYNLNPGNNSLTSSNIYPGIEVVSNNPSQKNQTMLFTGDFEGYYKFDPLKTQILSSSTYGLVKAISENSLINSNLDIAKSQDLVETTLDSISKSYFEFMSALNGDHSLFINELSKSFAVGSAGAIQSAAVQNAEKSEDWTSESFIEFATSKIGNVTITNSLNMQNINILSLVEAVSSGTAIGIQYSTILNNEDLDKEFQGLNRDIFAMHSSKGIAKGTIQSVSANIDQFTADSDMPSDYLISTIASHIAKGSVHGNTTLAVYNPPPRELLSIINNSAKGAAEGSTNVLELNNIDKSQNATEDVVVQIARASAHGSALAATFAMSTLDGAKPDTLSYDRKTISAVESATYGATYGAISGAIKNGVSDVVVIKQASKQGSTEGALIGAGLGTKHDEAFFNAEDKSFIDSELNSKKNIIKVIDESSSSAALNASTSRATKTIRTNSKNMIMLMRKFNISPRTTNPTRIFQKKSSNTNKFDSDFPIKDSFRAATPI